ncbi:VOC family protein [Streptomyces pseudogriseolus]|nr:MULTISPECIES: VOC family protein [Streptomyces]
MSDSFKTPGRRPPYRRPHEHTIRCHRNGAEAAGRVEAERRAGYDCCRTPRRWSFRARWRPPSGGARTSLAVRCEGPAEVDALFAELVEAGVRAELRPWDAVWGQRYAVVLDPDGNMVDLFAPLPAHGR